MQEIQTIPEIKKTYIFRVVIEEDHFEDGKEAYHIYCPALKKYSASTWGYTKEEALKNIKEVIEMIIEELVEDGISIPETPITSVQSELDIMVKI